MRVAYHPSYRYGLPPGHRFPMAKYELLPEQLVYEGTVTASAFFEPTVLAEADLLRTHTPDYYRRLTAGTLTRKEERAIGFPLSPKLVTRGRIIARGTLDCARYARRDGVALNVAGGTHHSFADRGEGFCVFNDIAVAANVLLDSGEATSIAVVDLDVHQGNGTAKLFAGEPRVFTLSVHGERNYPLRKEASDRDVGLPDGAGDADYLGALGDVLPDVLAGQQPDLVFYLAGVDVLAADRLGRLSLSRQGCRARDRYVFERCAAHGTPVAVCMGGGYAERLATVVDAHAATFQEAKAVFG